eukprot:296326-Rhodomonas_salina.1
MPSSSASAMRAAPEPRSNGWSAPQKSSSNQREGGTALEDDLEDLMVEDCDEDFAVETGSAPRGGGAKGRGGGAGVAGKQIDIKVSILFAGCARHAMLRADAACGENRRGCRGSSPPLRAGTTPLCSYALAMPVADARCRANRLKFGVVQTAGGPCGVLASVQVQSATCLRACYAVPGTVAYRGTKLLVLTARMVLGVPATAPSVRAARSRCRVRMPPLSAYQYCWHF